MKQKKPLLLGLATGVAAISVVSSGLRATAQKSAVASKKKEVHFASDQASSTTTSQGTIRTLEGNVVLTLEDTKLVTDKAMFNNETQVATSPGKVRLNDPYNTLTAQTGTAFYRTRDAQFRGNVIIVARPKPENAQAPEGSARRQFNSPVTIKSEKVDYNWRRRISIFNTPVTVTTKDRTVVADRATYDARTEVVTLDGNVRYTTPAGEKGQATKAVAVVTEGKEKFIAYGPVTGVVLVDAEDEPATPASAPTANTTGARSGVRPSTRPVPTSPPASSPAPPTSTPPSGTEGNNSDPGPAGTPGQPSPPAGNPGAGSTTP